MLKLSAFVDVIGRYSHANTRLPDVVFALYQSWSEMRLFTPLDAMLLKLQQQQEVATAGFSAGALLPVIVPLVVVVVW